MNIKLNLKILNQTKIKDDFVKYNICSFDIEASSSHGDFPLQLKIIKNCNKYYGKLNNKSQDKEDYNENILKK